MKHIQQLLVILLAVVCGSLAGCSKRPPEFTGEIQRTAPWDPELVEEISTLPVQDNGRVKPLATFAAFLLYKVHGRRDMKFATFDAEGQETARYQLDPTEWLLDVWCFPDQATDYPLFRIENVGVLDALGIENAGQTLNFQYLSYREILKVNEKLGELADSYGNIEARDRNAVQEHIVQSWRQLRLYHRTHQQLASLHHDFLIEGEELQAAMGGKERVRLGAFIERSQEFRDLVKSVGRDLESPKLGNAMAILDVLDRMMQQGGAVGLLPPPAGEETWMGLARPIDGGIRGTLDETSKGMFVALQAAIAADGAQARAAGLRDFRAKVVAAATERGEYEVIETEATYYRKSYSYQSLHWFIFGFLLAGVCWILPRNKLLWWASFVVTSFALCLLTYDIYLRCVISGRPPIKNLYDTFLFIGALGVLTSLIVEWVIPRRIALGLAPLTGGLLVMLARLFEVSDGKDTLDPLVAVLDSNYWLATHVTIINTGYAAGLTASVFALAWIFLRVTRIAHPSDSLSKGLVRAIYGVTCFSLLFSVVGTILGGVWANDSWGRFWGWDPKENGALMICLAQISLVHARFSGMIRDFGVVIWAAVTGMVVMFSWFHTNLLGVGLHNYGFSNGLHDGVWIGYVAHLGFMLIGAIDVFLRPHPARSVAAAAPLPATE